MSDILAGCGNLRVWEIKWRECYKQQLKELRGMNFNLYATENHWKDYEQRKCNESNILGELTSQCVHGIVGWVGLSIPQA